MIYRVKIYDDLDADDEGNGRKLILEKDFSNRENAEKEAESGKYDGEWTSVELEIL